MSVERRELALAKVLAGAAWADGEVSAAEAARIEKIAAHLDLSDAERDELSRTLREPASRDEVEERARKLLAELPPEERTAWLGRIEALLLTDDRMTREEQSFLAGVRGAAATIEDAPSLITRIRGILRVRRGGDENGPEGAEGAGGGGADRGGIVAQIIGRIGPGGVAEKRDPLRFGHAVLFGAILYRVAFADGHVDDAEIERVHALLTDQFGFGDEAAEYVIRTIRSRAADDFDRQRLCASFNRIAEMDARLKLLECLFAVAAADGEIREEELREMRLIANYLWIDAREFHRIRTKHWSEGGWRAT